MQPLPPLVEKPPKKKRKPTAKDGKAKRRCNGKQLEITSLFSPPPAPQCTCSPSSVAPTEAENNLLWTEQFRPDKPSSLIGNNTQWAVAHKWFQQRITSKLRKQDAEKSVMQPTCLLLVGPPGVGKTSAVHAMAGELELPLSEFNMSLLRDAATISEGVVGLLVTEKPQVICLEEIDGMSPQCIKAFESLLRNMCSPDDCEEKSHPHAEAWCQLNLLVATANLLTPGIAKLATYCHVVQVTKMSLVELRALADSILERSRVQIPPNELQRCIRDAGGDARSLLNQLQLISMDAPTLCIIHTPPPPPTSNTFCPSTEEKRMASISLESTIQSLLCGSGGPDTFSYSSRRWTIDQCQDLASTLPEVSDWCFHNYLSVWKKLRSNRTTSKKWVPQTEFAADILSDMDVIGSAEFGRGPNGAREIGRTIGAVRLHSLFSTAPPTMSKSKTKKAAVVEIPPFNKLALWSLRPDLDKCKTSSLWTEGQQVSRPRVAKKYPGRLDILALLDPNHSDTHCMWCQLGFPHDTVFSRDLIRFRKPWS